MKHQDLGLNLSKRRTRKAVFLDEMNLVVPWSELLSLIAPHAPRAKTGRPAFELETVLRIHFVQQWFGLSDLAMEEALFATELYRDFVGLSSVERIPDRVGILRFRRLLEEHHLAKQILATVIATLTDKGLMLREGTGVDATMIAAPSSTKNKDGERDPEMRQAKKGNQWHFGIKCHIGLEADSGLVHSVVGTAANVNDVTQASKLVHGEETDVFADAGYQGVADVMQAHWQASEQRIGQHPAGLCLQDTTELGFNGQQMRELGPLSYEAQRCLYLHPTYVVTPDHEPLGVTNAWTWAREFKLADGTRPVAL